ncbi:MAG: TolC family protein [Candidatus Gastranaerophilales bacterium]
MKKFISVALVASILSLNFSPAVFAVENQKKFKSSASKEKSSPDAYKFDYVNLKFWEDFNDETLNKYIKQAVLNNHDLKMASLSVDQYRENVKMQFAGELPSAVIGGFGGIEKPIGSTSTQGLFATPAIVSYELDIFGKNHNKTKAVKKLYEKSKQDEKTAYIAIASAVGTTYFNIVLLDETIRLQEEIVALREQIYNLMVLRNQEGLTSTSDTVKANKDFVQGGICLLDLEQKRANLLNLLAVLIGETSENSSSFERSSLSEIANLNTAPESIPTEIITQRPDYIVAELMVEKAGLDVKVAKKELLPAFNIGGVALFYSSGLGNLFNVSNALLALAGGALWPIFSGGRLMANMRSKKLAYESVLENYLKTNLVAIQEVNDALVNLKINNKKLEKTIEQAGLEQVELDYSIAKYNEGIISKLDLIQYEENLLSINKLVAQEKTQEFIDFIELYKSTGNQPYAKVQ